MEKKKKDEIPLHGWRGRERESKPQIPENQLQFN